MALGELDCTPKLLAPKAGADVVEVCAAKAFAPPNPLDTVGMLTGPPNPKVGLVPPENPVNADTAGLTGPALLPKGDCETGAGVA